MPSKTYQNANGQNIEVDGDESLLNFIDGLYGQIDGLKTEVSNKPNFAEHRKLWRKAEGYYEGNKWELDYTLDPQEVMKKCLESAKYDLKDVDEKTVVYLFNNVLAEYVDPNAPKPEEGGKKPQGVNKSQATPLKVTGKGMTTQEMSGRIQERRNQTEKK